MVDALDAVCRAESGDARRQGAAIACLSVLTVLTTDPPPKPADLDRIVPDLLMDGDAEDTTAVFHAFRRGLMPVEGALGVLQDFGAVDRHKRDHARGPVGGARTPRARPGPDRRGSSRGPGTRPARGAPRDRRTAPSLAVAGRTAHS